MNTELAHIIDMVHGSKEKVVVYDRHTGKSVVVSLLQTHGYEDVRVSNSELSLEQANRQIAELKENEKQKELELRVSHLEKQLQEHPLRDPFEEDFFHDQEWHKMSDVLDKEFQKKKNTEEDQDVDFSWLDEAEGKTFDLPVSRSSMGFDDSLLWDEDGDEDDFFDEERDNEFMYMEDLDLDDEDDLSFEEFLQRLPDEDVEYVPHDPRQVFSDKLKNLPYEDVAFLDESPETQQVSPRERMQEGFVSYSQQKSIPHTPKKDTTAYTSDEQGPEFFEEPV